MNDYNNSYFSHILKAFYDEHSLIPNQLSSYNDMILHTIPDLIENSPPIEIEINSKNIQKKFLIYFNNIFFEKPKICKKKGDNTSCPLFPSEARNRNITYESQIYIDIRVEDVETKKAANYSRIAYDTIPVMVKSILCNLHEISRDEKALYDHNEDPKDPGGYFILGSAKKGMPSERVVITQERPICNRVMTYHNKKRPHFETYADVRSMSGNNKFHTPFYLGIIKDGVNKGKMYATLPYIPENNLIPISLIFKALGAIEESEILRLVDPTLRDEELLMVLLPSLEDQYGIFEGENEIDDNVNCEKKSDDIITECLSTIGRMGKKFVQNRFEEEEEDDDEEQNSEKSFIEETDSAISYAEHLLKTEFIPHIEGDLYLKKYYLGYIVNRVITTYLRRDSVDDKDHCMNKRMAAVGDLMTGVFYKTFRAVKASMKKSIEEKGVNAILYGSINPLDHFKSSLTEQFKKCLGTGDWYVGKEPHSGVSQVFERLNTIASIAHLRKLNFPTKGDGKIGDSRKLHSSHYLRVCPFETPEGKQVGSVKSIAQTCYPSLYCDPKPLKKILLGYDSVTSIEQIDELLEGRWEFLMCCKIFINGSWIGVTNKPNELFIRLKNMKYNKTIVSDTGIVYNRDRKEIYISTEGGRYIAPLLRVVDGKILMTKNIIKDLKKGKIGWNYLVENGIVELLDAEEVDSKDVLVAMKPSNIKENPNNNYTHCEIHPSLMYGISAMLIPYSHCNQSPRNCYQCSMGKSAYGMPSLNFMQKNPGIQYVINYPQNPLVDSEISKIIGYDCAQTGQNAIVAIFNYKGFGQEDSIIINKQSVERGLFDTMKFKDYRTRVMVHKGEIMLIPSRELCHETVGKVTDIINDKKQIELDGIKITKKSYIDAKNIGDKVPYGVAKIGSIVRKGDIIICKLKKIDSKVKKIRQKEYKNESVVFNDYDSGRVTAVQYGYDGDGYFYINVKIAEIRFPELGDKWSSRHGQKGTCGLLVNQWDLPFSPDSYSAVYPDMIVNPLAIPSRMTFGHILECLVGKKVVCCDRVKNDILRKYRWYKILYNKAKNVEEVDKIYLKKDDIEKIYLPVIDGEYDLEEENIAVQIAVTNILKDKNFIYYKKRVERYKVPFKEIKNFYYRNGIKTEYGESYAKSTAFQDMSIDEIKRAFENIDDYKNIKFIDLIKQQLKNLGYEPHGHQCLMDGTSGLPIEGLVFLGPTYYQRLKHVVADKAHARSTGPIQPLTRQPVEGRANNGGHKFGEMEKDSIVSHGAPHFITDRLNKQSDAYNMFFCKHCGLQALVNRTKDINIKECRACDVVGEDHILKVNIPHTSKLVIQELLSAGIVTRCLVKKTKAQII